MGHSRSRTLIEKIWDSHKVLERDDGQTLLYIDRHFMGDDLLPDVFDAVRDKGLRFRRPDRTFATQDHYVPTTSRDIGSVDDPERRAMLEGVARNAAATGITFFGMDDPRQGIVHVVGPEQGLSLPGTTIVCGDSHFSRRNEPGIRYALDVAQR